MQLQQSEATAARRRIPIYLVDATDGKTPETGLSSGFTIEVSKNGAAQASGSGSITEIGDGHYYYEATSGELDTLGFISISIRHASCRDFAAIAQVVPWDVYKDFVTNIDDIETDTGTTLPATLTTIEGKVDTVDTVADAIKAKTDNLPADPASETNVNANETKIDALNDLSTGDVQGAIWGCSCIWYQAGGTFGAKNQKVVPSESINDYKADVSGLATSAALSTHDGKLDTVDTIVDAIKAVTDNLPDSGALTDIITKLKRLLGLHGDNCVIERTWNENSDNTVYNLYIYDSKANAETHNKSTGLLYEYSMACSDHSNNKPGTSKHYKES